MTRLRSLCDLRADEVSTAAVDVPTLKTIGLLAVIGSTAEDETGTGAELYSEDEPFPIKLILKRLGVVRPDLRFSTATVSCAALLGDRAGAWVLWAHFLVRATDAAGGRVLRPAEMVTRYFPNGFPKPETMRTLWEEQKTPEGRNLLDRDAAWAPSGGAPAGGAVPAAAV